MPEIDNTGPGGNSSPFIFGGQKAVSSNQQTLRGTDKGEVGVSDRTNEAMGAASGTAKKSKLGHWGVKFAAGFVIGLGIAASITGIGASAGVPLMAAGGALWAASSTASAINAGRNARGKGESVAGAVAWDALKSVRAGVAGVATPIIAALAVLDILNGGKGMEWLFAGAEIATHQNVRKNSDSSSVT